MAKAKLEEKTFKKIPEYMIEQNRPYSATDVYTNLRQEFGKQLVLKVLEASVVSGVLKAKVIGKQKIFYANQDKFEKYDDSAIADYDKNIDELTAKKLNYLHSTKNSRAEITARLKEKKKVAGMKAQLAKLESAYNPVVAEEGRKAVEMEASTSKSVRKRKAIAAPTHENPNNNFDNIHSNGLSFHRWMIVVLFFLLFTPALGQAVDRDFKYYRERKENASSMKSASPTVDQSIPPWIDWSTVGIADFIMNMIVHELMIILKFLF